MLELQDVYITGSTNYYYEDFSSGLANGWKTATEPHWSDWRVVDSNAYYRAGYVGPPVWFDIQIAGTNTGNEAGPDESAWQTIASAGVSNLSYRTYSIDVQNWDKTFVRIWHRTNDVSIVIDNIGMTSWRGTVYTNDSDDWSAAELWCVATGSNQIMNFDTWSEGSFSNYTYQGWIITNGMPTNGYCILSGTNLSYITSPAVSAAIASVSFYYRRDSGPEPARADLYVSSDSNVWDWLDTIRDITTTNMTRYFRRVNTANNYRYFKIQSPSSTGDLRVDDINVQCDHWIELWRKRACPTNAQYVMSPLLTNGIGYLTFDFMAVNPPVEFQIQRNTETNPNYFVTIETITVTNSTWIRGYTVNISVTNKPIRLRFLHTSTNENAILRLDNIEITDYTQRDSTMWYAYNALITHHSDQVPVDDKEFEPDYQPPEAVKTCYLNNNPGPDADTGFKAFTNDLPFVQSAYLINGIGEISFWYRNFANSGAPPATIIIRASPSETNAPSEWVELVSLTNITNTVYWYFTTNFYSRTNKYIRIYSSTNSSQRFAIDNILISEPIGADFNIGNVRTIPAIPIYTNEVRFSATLSGFFLDPNNIEVRAYYRIGTNEYPWGQWPFTSTNWVPLVMVSNTLYAQYYETPPGYGIPPQPIDTIVQYVIRCTFDGTFSEYASPKYHREFVNPSWYHPVDLNAGQSVTNPYYFVYSCLPGEVWINEFNIWDGLYGFSRTNQYIELCGKASNNINNWKIEILDTSFNTQAVYSVTNNPVFINETNGFGFWVIGSNGVPNIDQILTNDLPDEGGIVLKRSMGAIEHAVCYGDELARAMTNHYPFVYAGIDDWYDDLPLALVGSGTNASTFSWLNSGMFTPGYINDGQSFPSQNQPPPYIEITGFWLNSTSTWIVFIASNVVSPEPYYSTNLLQTNWEAVSSFNTISGPDNVYTQWFANMTNNPYYFYRIRANVP
jgi:hypothetical protein